MSLNLLDVQIIVYIATKWIPSIHGNTLLERQRAEWWIVHLCFQRQSLRCEVLLEMDCAYQEQGRVFRSEFIRIMMVPTCPFLYLFEGKISTSPPTHYLSDKLKQRGRAIERPRATQKCYIYSSGFSFYPTFISTEPRRTPRTHHILFLGFTHATRATPTDRSFLTLHFTWPNRHGRLPANGR